MLPERWTCALPDGTSPVSRRVSTSSGPHGKYSDGGMLSVGRSSSISTVCPSCGVMVDTDLGFCPVCGSYKSS